jgi:hypothetical protein
VLCCVVDAALLIPSTVASSTLSKTRVHEGKSARSNLFLAYLRSRSQEPVNKEERTTGKSIDLR